MKVSCEALLRRDSESIGGVKRVPRLSKGSRTTLESTIEDKMTFLARKNRLRHGVVPGPMGVSGMAIEQLGACYWWVAYSCLGIGARVRHATTGAW